MKNILLLPAVITLALLTGFILGQTDLLPSGNVLAGSVPQPTFHDLRVNPASDFVELIDPRDPEIRKLASRFDSFEAAYNFVQNDIRFAPFVPPGPVSATLKYGVGSCLGKAALLASLYRAMGMPQEDLRLVMGIVITPQGESDHVWLDLENKGRCLQQDPSGMLGRFAFDAFPGTAYVDNYVMKETFAFNDGGFALVSQLNRFRNQEMPGH